MEKEIVIVSGVRTPFSKFDSPMNDIASIDLGTMVLKEVVARVGIEPEEVDEVNYGASVEAEIAREQDVPDRQALLLGGFPPSTISMTINRACCASITAVRHCVRAIRVGDAEICIAAGSDNMPRAAHLAEGMRKGTRLGHVTIRDYLVGLGYRGFSPVATEAGEVAVEHGIGREMQDAWGLRSQELYAKALYEGKFKAGEEILPVIIPQKKGDPVVIERDEAPRKTSMEALAKLPVVYGSPTVTAGNAPPMNAGAGALLIMTREKAEQKGLKPLATILSSVAIASEPRQMAAIPGHAIHHALESLGMTIDQMDLIEINEAFAAVVLVSTKILSGGDDGKWEEIKAKTNVNGGAIAMGHPIAASGARIIMTLAYELQRRGGGYGVAAICGGLSQGEAVIIRV
ncbi:MAG: thiolase family protein [Deltaproteobacteria bacterium]|nr:thiolase family protein [Deltaproteobacteria bacterium]